MALDFARGPDLGGKGGAGQAALGCRKSCAGGSDRPHTRPMCGPATVLSTSEGQAQSRGIRVSPVTGIPWTLLQRMLRTVPGTVAPTWSP